MINNVTLVGRLTKDPEMKYTQSGKAVTRFTLAVNRSFTDANGNRDADFINITTWNKTAESAANYLRKGHLTGVEGRIQTGSYENQQGQRVFTTEVVCEKVTFLEPKGNNNGGGNQQNGQYNKQPNGQFNNQQNGQFNNQNQQGGQFQNNGQFNNQQNGQFNNQQNGQFNNQNNSNFQNNQPFNNGNQPFNNGQPQNGPIEVTDGDLPF